MRRVASIAWLVLCLAPGVLPARADEATLEFAVKATFLYKFAPFVAWPAPPAGPAPFRICVLGKDPFGPLLDRAVRDQKIEGRAIEVLRLNAPDRDAGCGILYVGADGAEAMEAIDATRGMPVLTVTDNATQPRARGIINFVLRENRVRFEIDSAAAARNGIAISSKLLSLALPQGKGD